MYDVCSLRKRECRKYSNYMVVHGHTCKACIVAKSTGLAGKSRFSMGSPAGLGHFPASQAA